MGVVEEEESLLPPTKMTPSMRRFLDQYQTIEIGEVTAITRDQAPFSFPCVMQDPQCRPGGINIDIFRAIMTFLGLRFRFIPTEEDATGYKDDNGSWVGLVGQLERGEADMSASLISVKSSRMEAIDYSAPVSYYLNGFIIRKPQDIDVTASPAFLASPLKPTVWMYMGIATMAVIFTVLGFRIAQEGRRSQGKIAPVSEVCLLVVRSVFRQSILDNPLRTVTIVLSAWEFAMFFVVSFYSAHLTSSFLVSGHSSDPFTGYDQLAQAIYDRKYRLVTEENPQLDKFQVIANMKDSRDPQIKVRIGYQWNPPLFVNDELEAIEAIKSNQSLVFFGSYYRLLDLTAKHCTLKVIEDRFTMPKWLSFAFPKGSRLQEIVSLALHTDSTSVNSFLQRLYKRYSKTRKCRDPSPSDSSSTYAPLKVKQIQGSLWILLYGLALAQLWTILETISKPTLFRHMLARLKGRCSNHSNKVVFIVDSK